MRARTTAGLLALGLAAVATSAGATDKPPTGREQCFRSHDYQAFRPVDDHTFNICVGVNDYYRIDTEGTCPALTYPQAFLITQVRGSDLICGPLDWDLRIGQTGPGGFSEPCIVKSQSKLTAAEAAALPKRDKP